MIKVFELMSLESDERKGHNRREMSTVVAIVYCECPIYMLMYDKDCPFKSTCPLYLTRIVRGRVVQLCSPLSVFIMETV